MPHRRGRYLEPLLRKGLAHKGIVGVFGHRQVGKTTLLELLAATYRTFDRGIDARRASENPSGFLADLAPNGMAKPVAIDECQMVPEIFPELKELVRIRKEPGLFLLSGSVRFSSRMAIRESLTGRMLSYELLPFSISEIAGLPINRLALDLLERERLTESSFGSRRTVGLANCAAARRYLSFGGLPGICFVRSDRDRVDLLESQIDLILDRDLRLVCETKLPLSRLRIVAQILAQNQNRPLNLSEVSRKARVAQQTLRKVMTGLEAVFFIRILNCEGNEARPVLFLEDQGEAAFLAGGRFDQVDDLERLAFSHLRVPFAYEPGLSFECFQYRQQGGAYVPLCFRSGGRVIGFILSADGKPSLSAIRSGGSFMKTYPGAKVIHLHPGRQVELLGPREASLPIEYFL